ncbi:MAG: hypothetical protein ACI9VS_003601, partial [Candidatus Binatia bacterium]
DPGPRTDQTTQTTNEKEISYGVPNYESTGQDLICRYGVLFC